MASRTTRVQVGQTPLTPWQAWLSMLGIRLPLSGDVSENIAPTIGLFNIGETRSGDPMLERRIVSEVASYGRQLGWLVDAVGVLASSQDRHDLHEADIRALDQIQDLAQKIAAAKEQDAADHADHIVGQVQALSEDPETNAEALRRIRDALPGRGE